MGSTKQVKAIPIDWDDEYGGSVLMHDSDLCMTFTICNEFYFTKRGEMSTIDKFRLTTSGFSGCIGPDSDDIIIASNVPTIEETQQKAQEWLNNLVNMLVDHGSIH